VKGGLDLEKVIGYALRRGFDEAAAAAIETVETSLELEADEVSNVSHILSRRLSITLVKGKSIVSGYSNRFSLEEAYGCVDKLYRMALVSTPNKHWRGLPQLRRPARVPQLYDAELAEMGGEDIVELGKDLLNKTTGFSGKVHVMSGGLSRRISKLELALSNGFQGEEETTTIIAYLVTVAREPGATGSFAVEEEASRRLDIDLDGLAERAAQKALDSLKPKPVEGFRGDLIMDHDVAAMLFLALAQAYNGDAVWRGKSPLGDKLGTKIAAEKLRVVDDGTVPGGLASSSFDGEGTPTQRTEVVDRGVLKCFINNTFTANLLGMAPTGNASSLLEVAPTNTMVGEGDLAKDEMIEETGRGILVGRFSGMIRYEDGVVSGVLKQAWLVENGEVRYPVGECMVAGNMYDWLKSLACLSRESKWTATAVKTPWVKVSDVTFVAK